MSNEYSVLGGPWDLVTTYNWDYNPTYSWGNPHKQAQLKVVTKSHGPPSSSLHMPPYYS